MNSLRFFRVLGYINLVAGCLMASLVVALTAGLLKDGPARTPAMLGATIALLTIFAAMSFVIFRTVQDFFRSPDRNAALKLARNTAVVEWFVVSGLLQETKAENLLGPLYAIVGMLVAYSTYRFLLKPAALAVFPETVNPGSN